MAKNKREFWIDVASALLLFKEGFGFGFRAVVMNWYQIRIQCSNSNAFFDWYHTTGSTVINFNGSCARFGTYGDPFKLAIAINKYVYKCDIIPPSKDLILIQHHE